MSEVYICVKCMKKASDKQGICPNCRVPFQKELIDKWLLVKDPSDRQRLKQAFEKMRPGVIQDITR